MLFALEKANPLLAKAIFKHSDDDFIKAIHESLHNVLAGNIPLNQSQLQSLKKHKQKLRKINYLCHKQKCIKKKRAIFLNQRGNNPLFAVLGYIGRAALTYLAEQGIETVVNKVKEFINSNENDVIQKTSD